MKKTTLVIIILSLCTVFLFLFLIINYQKKDGQPITINDDFLRPLHQEKSNFQESSIMSKDTSFPTSLPLLNITTSSIENFSNKLNEYCQIKTFEKNYAVGNICHYTTFNNNFNVQLHTADSNKSTNIANLMDVIKTNDILFNQIYNTELIKIDQKSITYLSGEDEELQPTTSDNATVIDAFYDYQYNGVPIRIKNQLGGTFYLITDSNNRVLKAELVNQKIDFQPQETLHHLISATTALQNIEQGNGFLLNYDDLEYIIGSSPELNISLFKKTVFNEISLEYRYITNLAIPCYHFSGTGFDAHNNKVDLEVVTPAINFTITPSAQ